MLFFLLVINSSEYRWALGQDEVGEVADVSQIGTRNFQNYTLLDALGKCNTKSTPINLISL